MFRPEKVSLPPVRYFYMLSEPRLSGYRLLQSCIWSCIPRQRTICYPVFIHQSGTPDMSRHSILGPVKIGQSRVEIHSPNTPLKSEWEPLQHPCVVH